MLKKNDDKLFMLININLILESQNLNGNYKTIKPAFSKLESSQLYYYNILLKKGNNYLLLCAETSEFNLFKKEVFIALKKGYKHVAGNFVSGEFWNGVTQFIKK